MSDSVEEIDNPSMRRVIADLDVGECYARCERIELELLTKDRIVETTRSMRNTICAAARRAKDHTGHNYAVETGNFLTATRDLILFCVVTRRT